MIAIFLFVLLYSYVAVTGNLRLGIRHILPIFPFLYILITIAIFKHEFSRFNSRKKQYTMGLIAAIVFFLIIETLAAFPFYTSYFNLFVGGSKQGYKYVVDSNSDWGQDLNRLKEFLALHPEIESIRIDYFGQAEVSYYLKDKYIPWEKKNMPLEKGYYAISADRLQNSIYNTNKSDNQSYYWTRGSKSFAQIGTSIFVYKID